MATKKERTIWHALYSEIKNSYGTAALMGNLFAESSLNTSCVTKSKMTTQQKNEYLLWLDSEDFTKDKFSKDGVAFGLAQWLYYSRKEALYDFYKNSKAASIRDLDVQLGYLLEEIKKYKTVWNTLLNAKSIREASDIVLEKYEKPESTTEATKQKRAGYGEKYFSEYASEEDSVSTPILTPTPKTVVTTAPRVFVRVGNGTNYEAVGKIITAGFEYPWVATSENNWHAIRFYDRVLWISGEYSKVRT